MLSRFATLGGGGDPYWNNVSYLLVGNGANGTTTNIKDSSSNNLANTVNGSTVISTARSKYGSGSVFTQTTNNGSNNISIAPTTLLTLGTDFTVEAWVQIAANNTYSVICSKGNGTSREWSFLISSSIIRFYVSTDGTGAGDSSIDASYAFQLDTWYYVAFSKSGSVVRLFVNGNSLTTTGSFTSVYGGNGIFRVGTFMDYTGISHCLAGYIYDLRITKGVCRYTASFTPPTGPLPTYGP
jgi:hypothetical protein